MQLKGLRDELKLGGILGGGSQGVVHEVVTRVVVTSFQNKDGEFRLNSISTLAKPASSRRLGGQI